MVQFVLYVFGGMDQGGKGGPDFIVVVGRVAAQDIGPDHRGQRHFLKNAQAGDHVAGNGVAALAGLEIDGKGGSTIQGVARVS